MTSTAHDVRPGRRRHAERGDPGRPVDSAGSTRWWPTGWRAVVTATVTAAVVLIPSFVALVAIVRPQWYPTGDMAQAELHVRGFWSHPPLVGAAGRISDSAGVQGSHPGPLLWLAMWPVYALGGASSAALSVSVFVVHLATATLALWLAVRRGGVVFGVGIAVALALVVRAGGPEQFTEPWNPWMGLLPFLVMLLAAWSFLESDGWALALAVVAGSYSIQAHVGYAPVVLGVLTFAVAVVAARAWRGGAPADAPAAVGTARARVARWVGAAAAVGVLAWIPPIVDQIRRTPGNLSILRATFGNPDGPYLGLADVAEIVVVQFNVLGPWVFGPGRADFGVVAAVGFVGFVAVWVAAVVTARRRAATSELHLHAVLAVASVLAVVSISRIFGTYFEYTVRWVWLIVATVVATSMVGLWSARPATWRAPRPTKVALAVPVVATLAIVGVATGQFAARAEPTGMIDGRIVAGLVESLDGRLDPDTDYLLRWWDPGLLGATAFGLLLELERQGFTVGVDPQFAAAALPHRVQSESSAGAILYLVLGEGPIERARAADGLTEIAAFDVRSDRQRARSDALRVALEAELAAAGQAERIALLDARYGQVQLQFADPPAPPAAAPLLAEYIELRQPAVVFQAAPGTALPSLE